MHAIYGFVETIKRN